MDVSSCRSLKNNWRPSWRGSRAVYGQLFFSSKSLQKQIMAIVVIAVFFLLTNWINWTRDLQKGVCERNDRRCYFEDLRELLPFLWKQKDKWQNWLSSRRYTCTQQRRQCTYKMYWQRRMSVIRQSLKSTREWLPSCSSFRQEDRTTQSSLLVDEAGMT